MCQGAAPMLSRWGAEIGESRGSRDSELEGGAAALQINAADTSLEAERLIFVFLPSQPLTQKSHAIEK